MYVPLDTAKRQIRLLHLDPGEEDTELSGALRDASLDDEPVYEAIPYVWGAWEDPGSIIIKQFEEVVSITANLQAVLRSVRLPNRPRVLWVDALCVNQNDLEERGSQVSIMGEVYGQAHQVLVHLGDSLEGCELAIEAVRRLGDDTSLNASTYMDHGLNIRGVGL